MQTDPSLPDRFSVAVLIERRPGVSRWQPLVWVPVGLVAGAVAEGRGNEPLRMSGDGDAELTLWRGFAVKLHRDEAESYYYNLLSPDPQAFIVMRKDESSRPFPALVTLSFDEANAYAEGDDDVEAVSMPPELSRWVEAFVIDNYVPEKRIKRKRRAWTESP